MFNGNTRYRHDRKLCSFRLFSFLLFIFRTQSHLFFLSACATFSLFNCSNHGFLFNCVVSNYPAPPFSSHRQAKEVSFFTPGVSVCNLSLFLSRCVCWLPLCETLYSTHLVSFIRLTNIFFYISNSRQGRCSLTAGFYGMTMRFSI